MFSQRKLELNIWCGETKGWATAFFLSFFPVLILLSSFLLCGSLTLSESSIFLAMCIHLRYSDHRLSVIADDASGCSIGCVELCRRVSCYLTRRQEDLFIQATFPFARMGMFVATVFPKTRGCVIELIKALRSSVSGRGFVRTNEFHSKKYWHLSAYSNDDPLK